jgi:protein gp37
MSNTSTIEWTDASLNTITGCQEVSPGCDHCYARTFAERFRGVPGHPFEHGFDLTFHPERLGLPGQWKKPKRIFVNSMSDFFHKDVPDSHIIDLFKVMAKVDRHVYQILTKRPSRLVSTDLTEKIINAIGPWPRHIWLGVSVENQGYIWRIDKLCLVPAPIRFISAEPLLGPLEELDLMGISWLIAGAESGHGARPMDENWVRSLRDQCTASDVAFFYKQNALRGHKIPLPALDGKVWNEFPA